MSKAAGVDGGGGEGVKEGRLSGYRWCGVRVDPFAHSRRPSLVGSEGYSPTPLSCGYGEQQAAHGVYPDAYSRKIWFCSILKEGGEGYGAYLGEVKRVGGEDRWV